MPAMLADPMRLPQAIIPAPPESVRAHLGVLAGVVILVLATAASAADRVRSMEVLRKTRVRAVVPASGRPDWITAAFGKLWLANGSGVLQISPKTNKVLRLVARGTQPCEGLAAGFGSIWIVDCNAGRLLRINPASGRLTASVALPLGSVQSEGYIAVDRHAVWVPLAAGQKGALDRIDPATNKITAKIPLPADSSGATAGFGAIWVTSSSANAVFRVDPATNAVVAKVQVDSGPRFIAAGAGGVWALNQGDGSVSHLDPGTNTVVATIPLHLPGNGGCIAAGFGRVWVTMPGTPFNEIDASSNAIVGQWKGPGGDCITTGFASVWLVNHDRLNVWRITTRP